MSNHKKYQHQRYLTGIEKEINPFDPSFRERSIETEFEEDSMETSEFNENMFAIKYTRMLNTLIVD